MEVSMEKGDMTTRLVINLREGVVEVEGGEEFVRSIYDDFKERVSRPTLLPAVPPKQLTTDLRTGEDDDEGRSSRRKAAKKSTSADTKKAKAVDYKPTFNSKLDISGLETFQDQFVFANNSERILAFAIFLRDQLGIAPCSADDIFTCFFTLKHKCEVPEAFLQSFRTAKHRTHFIDYSSFEAIEVTIAGDNHFKRLKKAGAE
jgi:hypothetical protein